MICNIGPFGGIRKDINDATVTDNGSTYSGMTKYAKDQLTIQYNDNTLVYGTDYVLVSNSTSTISAINANSYIVTIEGVGNYIGTRGVKWKINPQPVTCEYDFYLPDISATTKWSTSITQPLKISATGIANGVRFQVKTRITSPSGLTLTPTLISYNVSGTAIGVVNTSTSNGVGEGTVYFKRSASTTYSVQAYATLPTNYKAQGWSSSHYLQYNGT